MARKITESIMMAINNEDKLVESIGTETDIDNLNQEEKDAKIIKLAKSIAKGNEIDIDKFRELRDRLTSSTYKMVDKIDTYNLQRGEEVLNSWKKKESIEEAIEVLETEKVDGASCCECNNGIKEDGSECDCKCHKEILPDAEKLGEEEVDKTVQNGIQSSVQQKVSTMMGDEGRNAEEFMEGHTDDLIAEVLELAKEQGKNWTEEALRKLTVPQLHVIKSKLINPEYKTRKELAKEKEREESKRAKAELVKSESDGSITYKIRVGETETILEADSDDAAIDAFDKLYPDKKEVELKDSGISGLKTATTDGFKVYVKETLEGKYAYIIRDIGTSTTISSGEADSEDKCVEKVNEDLERLDNEE